MLVSINQSAHWYRHNGQWEPFYEMPKADGKGMRAPTITDARKLGLAPSVTGILSILDKPMLTAWKIEQGILAALTLPRLPNEPDDAFARRVVEDSESQSRDARELGTKIHKFCEDYALAAQSKKMSEDTFKSSVELLPYVASFVNWFNENVSIVYGAETYCGDAMLGYAGKLDLLCAIRGMGEAVVDFKTQKVKANGKGKKPAFYDEWGLQLSAYAHAVSPDKHIARMSVIIDTSEPGPIHIHEWTEHEKDWQMFQHCFELWKWQKQYDPAQQPQPESTEQLVPA